MSEDCLTLNVWTPMRSSAERLPVMVWIHGGGFFGGTASSATYDGDALARRGVVVVTLNYRIGALGFLAHPDLSAESPRHVSGNYGLLDQIAALKWVQQNIGAFGGDPKSVTVFGGSAGAYSISVLMVSPLAKGLFHRAIVESLPLGFRPARRLRESRPLRLSAESEGKSQAAGIREMRRLDAQEIVARIPSSPTLSTGAHFYPVVDGWVLPDDPSVLIGTALQARVPVLIGFNAAEGNFFIGNAPTSVTAYHEFLRAKFPAERVDQILAMYPAGTDADVPRAIVSCFGDYELIASTILTARAAARTGQVYVYRFSLVSPINARVWNGAAHTTEIPYVFDHIETAAGEYDDTDRAVSKAMAGAWVQFAKGGSPNAAGLPAWPVYNANKYLFLDYGDTISVAAGFHDQQVEFFRSVFDAMRVQ